MNLTREQFLERCAAAFDAGRITPESLLILDRWSDMVMRLEGGQPQYFSELLTKESERLDHFHPHRTLHNDTDGYRVIEFAATLRHPCHICATDPENLWVTRFGFCQHKGSP